MVIPLKIYHVKYQLEQRNLRNLLVKLNWKMTSKKKKKKIYLKKQKNNQLQKNPITNRNPMNHHLFHNLPIRHLIHLICNQNCQILVLHLNFLQVLKNLFKMQQLTNNKKSINQKYQYNNLVRIRNLVRKLVQFSLVHNLVLVLNPLKHNW